MNPPLVIGYGNPARGDDGLGPALAKAIEQDLPDQLQVITPFQLMVEHALMIHQAPWALLIDASRDCAKPFEFAPLQSEPAAALDSHGLSPGGLLALGEILYGGMPPCFLLAVRGQDFGPFQERISGVALDHLHQALDFVRHWLAGDPGHSHGRQGVCR